MDIQFLMKQAKKLEKAMAEARQTLADLTVDGESGGGLVKVTMNGRCDVVKLAIDPKAIDPADPSLLEDLLTAALNATAEKARAAADEHLGKATGGVKIPGIMG
jgi:DNA-binding YbaB/EbfC family protein